jgi:hypothetical protein
MNVIVIIFQGEKTGVKPDKVLFRVPRARGPSWLTLGGAWEQSIKTLLTPICRSGSSI